MATNKNITMKQYNGLDYDTLYPKTIASQIDDVYSKDEMSNLFLPKAGGSMGGILDMNGNKITNLPTPISNSEPATKGYLETEIGKEIANVNNNIKDPSYGATKVCTFETGKEVFNVNINHLQLTSIIFKMNNLVYHTYNGQWLGVQMGYDDRDNSSSYFNMVINYSTTSGESTFNLNGIVKYDSLFYTELLPTFLYFTNPGQGFYGKNIKQDIVRIKIVRGHPDNGIVSGNIEVYVKLTQ